MLLLFWGDLLKTSAKNKKLFFIFVDMEKTFDWVPREVINFALRRNPSKYPRTFGGCSYVSLQRLKSCCLSWWGPIKFIFCESWCSPKVCFDYTMVIYVWTCRRYVLCGESLNEVTDKYGRWKNTVEGKGLRANVNKMKGIQLLIGKKK